MEWWADRKFIMILIVRTKKVRETRWEDFSWIPGLEAILFSHYSRFLVVFHFNGGTINLLQNSSGKLLGKASLLVHPLG